MRCLSCARLIERILAPSFIPDLGFIWNILMNLVNTRITVHTVAFTNNLKLINLKSIIAELGLTALYTSNSNVNNEDLRYMMLIYEANNSE
ncbi:hypothetical protein [Caldivirga sp. UBA161]|uniref:hypothetical protein n=1 Tax=Caldivirga sp. UBA161 TaxID=1915569 RepID=UPI0025C63511|nr:hypothetical protein [Caldivirga sp. UBA161]